MIEDIAEQLRKSRQFTMYSVGGLCVALTGGCTLLRIDGRPVVVKSRRN